MKREKCIEKIGSMIESENKKYGLDAKATFDAEDLDVWVNNSDDANGEDLQVGGIGYSDGKFGVFVCDDDFFPFEELSDTEIEDICETMEDYLR